MSKCQRPRALGCEARDLAPRRLEMVGPTIGRAVAAMWSLAGAVERGSPKACSNDCLHENAGLEASESAALSAELFDGSEAEGWHHLHYNRLTAEVARWELERLLNQARGWSCDEESSCVANRASGGVGTRAGKAKVPEHADNTDQCSRAASETDSHEKSKSSQQEEPIASNCEEVTRCEHVKDEQSEELIAEVETDQHRPNRQEVVESANTMHASNVGSGLQMEHLDIQAKARRQTPRPSSASSTRVCRDRRQSMLMHSQHSMDTSSSNQQCGRQASVGPTHDASSPQRPNPNQSVRQTSMCPTQHMSFPLCNNGDICDVRNLVRVTRLREAIRGRAPPGSNHHSRSSASVSRPKTCQTGRIEDHYRRIQVVGDTKPHARTQSLPMGLCAKSPASTKLQGLTLDAFQVHRYKDVERLAFKRSHVEGCRAAVAAISSKSLLVVPVKADARDHKCSSPSPSSTPDIAKSKPSLSESFVGQVQTNPDQKRLQATGICIRDMSEATEIVEDDHQSFDPTSCGVPLMDCNDDGLSSSTDSGPYTIARPVSGVKVFVRPRSAPAGIAGSRRGNRSAVIPPQISIPMKH